jgi:hypothetical protein
VSNASREIDFVGFELHPSATTITEPPPGQVGLHHFQGDGNPGRETLQHGNKFGSV